MQEIYSKDAEYSCCLHSVAPPWMYKVVIITITMGFSPEISC